MSLALRVPVQARSLRTRSDLVAAARAEFADHGYAVATAKSIAARAGVGTGTFYHYFPDKDVVLREIVAERMARFEDSLTSRDVELKLDARSLNASLSELRRLIRRDIKTYLAYHAEDKGLHAVISERRLCDSELDAIMSAVEQRGVRRTAEALKRWGFAGDTQAAAFMIFSLIDGAVHNHVLADSPLSDARFIDGLLAAIVSIGAPPEILAALSKGR